MLTKDVNAREVRGEIISPSGRVECRLTWNGTHGKGTFVPTEVGMHKVRSKDNIIRKCSVWIIEFKDNWFLC